MKKAKTIMVLGTMSNVGKSIVATGLCRILSQDGFSVAPFKSQNMSSNVFVTRDGLQMSQAQVVQAEACGKEPSVLMNPIVLKPSSNSASQVIVLGENYGEYKASSYYSMKKTLREKVVHAFETLQKDNDVIVIEGAGSPAELNLNADDFVNLGMAKIANAPCLLVGNIDLGGVFAQLYGTIKLLPQTEQAMIKGLIVNKFRGDKNLFADGIRLLEKITEKEVLGVLPFLKLNIDDEDSLASKFSKKEQSLINIDILKLPHLANFNDFAVLEQTEKVAVRYVDCADEMISPDVIIIPDTKKPADDLLWLYQNGFDTKIVCHVENNKLLFGIAGGYEMLGRKVIAGNENTRTETKGLNLLPIVTMLTDKEVPQKVAGCVQMQGGGIFAGADVSGFVVQSCTVTTDENVEPFICGNQGSNNYADGVCRGRVFGMHLHEFFDSEAVREKLFAFLAEQRNIDKNLLHVINRKAEKEKAYDALAAAMRENLNVDAIKKIIGI